MARSTILPVLALLCVPQLAIVGADLSPRAFKPLPVGSITPKGWLLKQLTLQAEGLSGHLAQFWNDVMASSWIGGGGDGGLHERAPYWLNGVVPLAFLLKNAGVEELQPVTGIYKAAWGNDAKSYGNKIPTPIPVNVMAQVEKYISYILSHQGSDGWLGPAMDPKDGGSYWGPSNALQALYMYAEGSNDPAKFTNASQAILLHLLEQKRRMASAKLASWSAARWIDMALTAEWLIDNADVGTHKQDLLDLIGMLHDQGSDWDQWFETFTGNAGGHNVNNAQGLKSAAVYSRYNATATYDGYSMRELSKRRMAHLDEKYGLPSGMFNGDENLPTPATRSPSHGIELCGVVEAMFSYNTMFSVHGDISLVDRAERIAYNALPATWASPKGGDMWAHQYLQAINEINAIKADPHVWQTDGDMAETYGLEPNYGCCTANFNQGWPKYASMLMYTAPDGGAVVGSYAPASAVLPNGVSLDIDTEYPFGDVAIVTVKAKQTTSVYLRIPAWAVNATVDGTKASNGTMWVGKAAAGTTKFTVDFAPTIRLEEWDNGAVSVHRGALMYVLPIMPNYTVYGHHFGGADMSNDYFLVPTSKWQYALDADPRAPSESLTFVQDGYKAGAAPFNHSGWPTAVSANMRFVPSWAEVDNSAAPPPSSPACGAGHSCGPAEKLQLVPYGGTELRIGEMPLASYPGLDASRFENAGSAFVV